MREVAICVTSCDRGGYSQSLMFNARVEINFFPGVTFLISYRALFTNDDKLMGEGEKSEGKYFMWIFQSDLIVA